mmetsp:Transcript_17327/g.50379  ORF Transcript_17327/g.50379 Transcript_17327/m.50379 type:complete len:155 (-) Transcript_17327:36-500(-)
MHGHELQGAMIAFTDDMHLFGPPESLDVAFHLLRGDPGSPCALSSVGLALQPVKCEVWAPWLAEDGQLPGDSDIDDLRLRHSAVACGPPAHPCAFYPSSAPRSSCIPGPRRGLPSELLLTPPHLRGQCCANYISSGEFAPAGCEEGRAGHSQAG